MANSTRRRRTTNGLLIPVSHKSEPQAKRLPVQTLVVSNGFSLSFSCFDRNHELFNLGCNERGDAVSGSWFIDLLDCLKSVCGMTTSEMKQSMHQLHPVRWDSTNTTAPFQFEHEDFWQFRINKSKGRVIGFIIDGVFYILWLDPHHNLSDSEGYGKAVYYTPGKSDYQILTEKLDDLVREVAEKESSINILTDMIEELERQL